MNNEILIKRLNILLYISVIVFFIGDVLRKCSIFFDFDFIRHTAISKLIVLLIYLATIATSRYYFLEKKAKTMIFLTAGLVFVYFLGQFFLIDTHPILEFNNNILILIRYLFWPVTFIVFWPLITDSNYRHHPFKLFEAIFLINAGIILLSSLLNITIFQTYFPTDRFGYMGIYSNHNQTSYYFIIMILYYYYHMMFKGAKKSLFIAIVIISLLVGTKKIYFFLLALTAYHFFRFNLWKSKRFYVLAILTVVPIFLFVDSIKHFVLEKFKVLFTVYQESGVWTALTSYRNENLKLTLYETVLKNWRWPNYFLGGPRFYEHRTEFGFVDLYLFFGILGLITFFKLFKMLYNVTGKNHYFLLVIVFLTLTAFFAEGFFSSANQPIVFLFITMFFATSTNKNRMYQIDVSKENTKESEIKTN